MSTRRDAVAIVRTGTANLASVRAAFSRLGLATELVERPEALRDAARLVLPGVGAFGAAMEVLRRRDLVEALRERVAADRPTLAICLGLQVLAEGSEESPGVAGLGVVPGVVRSFSASARANGLRVPHLGWNRVAADGGLLARDGHAYFVHGYYLAEQPPGWRAAWCTYGPRFVAALERGRVLACQFHPELSGAFGRGWIERWLAAAGAPIGEGSAC